MITLVLVGVLVIDLVALGLFKYYGSLAGSLASLLGAHADWVTLHLVLPVGVSYYTFQNLSYVIDAYEAFSKGLVNLRAESRESVDRAILFFERAVALEACHVRFARLRPRRQPHALLP